MRSTSIILLSLLCNYVLGQNIHQVILTGRLINFNTRVTVMDYSEMSDLELPNNKREIIPDSNGYFKISFPLETSGYFRLGNNILYLTPGSHLNLQVDYSNSGKAIFQGSLSEENNYLKNIPWPQSGSYLDGSLNIKPTLQKTIDTILVLADNSRRKLDSLNHVSDDFKKLENARIDADILNSFKTLAGIYISKRKTPRDQQLKVFKVADSLTTPLVKQYAQNLVNADFLKISSFRQIYNKVDNFPGGNKHEQDKIKDWEYADDVFYEINSAPNKKELLKLQPKLDSIKNLRYRSAVVETFKLKSEFWDGDAAKDFTAVGINNQAVKLSSFKGKVIVIDLWATWCGPCLTQMPYYDKLKQQFDGNPDIVFISLCVLDSRNRWEKNVLKENRQGIQLFTDQSQVLPYKILTLPRTMIIDKDFKVNKMYGPLPSSSAMKNDIDWLLKK